MLTLVIMFTNSANHKQSLLASASSGNSVPVIRFLLAMPPGEIGPCEGGLVPRVAATWLPRGGHLNLTSPVLGCLSDVNLCYLT